MKVWIARDTNDSLNGFSVEPERFIFYHVGFFKGDKTVWFDDPLFPEITWENGPVEFELVKVEK